MTTRLRSALIVFYRTGTPSQRVRQAAGVADHPHGHGRMSPHERLMRKRQLDAVRVEGRLDVVMDRILQVNEELAPAPHRELQAQRRVAIAQKDEQRARVL